VLKRAKLDERAARFRRRPASCSRGVTSHRVKTPRLLRAACGGHHRVIVPNGGVTHTRARAPGR